MGQEVNVFRSYKHLINIDLSSSVISLEGCSVYNGEC